MKANGAPEKIYLEAIYPDNGVLPNGLNYAPSPTDIEYTQTNAFTEKAKKWFEEHFGITFTQSVEVDVDEEMLPLIEDYWCQEINIAECHKDPKEKKIADFLDKQVDFDNAGDINVEIELYNEV